MKLINQKIIDSLFQSLGLKFLAQKDQNEMMTRILKIISKRAGAKVVDNLSEEEIEEFNKISENDFDKMEDFMIAKNPKAKEIFQKEAEAVQSEMLSGKTNA